MKHIEIIKDNIQCKRITYLCDECGCEVEQEGYALASYPTMYSYICPDCGWKLITTEFYPRLELQTNGGKVWQIPE